MLLSKYETNFPGFSQYSPTGNNFEGLATAGYNATIGFYYLSLAMLSTIFMICSLRINIVFFSALFLLVFAFGTSAGAVWNVTLGNEALAERLLVTSGAFTFALTMLVWYLLLVQLLESVDFPITLPVGDLSQVFPGKTERENRIKNKDNED